MKRLATYLNVSVSISVIAAALATAAITTSSLVPRAALAQTPAAPAGAAPTRGPGERRGMQTPVGARLAGLPDPYRIQDNWAKMPAGRVLGGAAGIAIDPDGKSVWIFERCGNANDGCALPENKDVNPILEFDTNGNLIKQMGGGVGIKYPHGIFIDKNHNVWVADGIATAGRGAPRPPSFVGDTVREFSPDGKLLMTLGKPGVIGSGPYEFNGVSAVLVAPNGDIFVADGHGGKQNDRIIKYDSQGKFLMQWGHYGPPPDGFNPPHAIAMDKEGRIYVADRSNKVVQVYDQNGKLLHVWDQFGQPSGVYVDKNDMLYVADCNSTDDPTDQWYDPGFSIGVRVANVSDGKIVANIVAPFSKTVPYYCTMEGVTADDAGTVYVSCTNIAGSHRWFRTKS